MTVKITSASHINSWYKNKIGETFEVTEHPTDDNVWQVIKQPAPHIHLRIKKSECVEVKEEPQS